METKVYKRTFEAEQYPKESEKRELLNSCAETSEYMHSHKYGVIGDGFCFSFRTKAEAQTYADKKNA